jgi:hypothetical protein
VVGKINGLTRLRIILAGGCLSLVTGFPMLHLVDPEPPEFWVPFVVLIAVCGVMLGGYSARRRVLTDERRFVTGYLLFGRLCWWRRRWRPQDCGPNEFVYWHALFVCRSRRRQLIASMYTNDRDAPDMEIAADRVAKLVDLPYEGYRESKVLWWAS